MAIGCTLTDQPWAVLPEQRTIAYRDPSMLPPAPIPPSVPPRTVSDPRPGTAEWRLSLDEAIRIALENGRVVRVLAGVTAVSSGRTIYDPAISNTVIDQEQGRFDPVASHRSRWTRQEMPSGIPDIVEPLRVRIIGSDSDEYRQETGLTKTNLLGGQWGLNWVDTPTTFGGAILPALNPQNRSFLETSYTQPLLQGGGVAVNAAPIVIARINTERSFFQYKDGVQELVRGVIEAYWNLVQARIDLWARQIQVEQSEYAFQYEEARMKAGLADIKNVAQAKVTYTQFKAALIAAEAALLAREGALRNILGLPPDDDRVIVPTSAPIERRLKPEWDALVRLAEQRRPDIVELKLVLEAERQRLIQAENNALPRLDAQALYRWNGLSGEMPNGERISTHPGEFTDWSIGVNFSVPLGLRQARAGVRQQNLIIARERAFIEQSVHAAQHELALSTRELDSAYEQYRAFKETRAAALENLKVQTVQFRADRAIYLNVLVALNDWGNAVTSEARALVNYNVGLATLERQTGTILESHGLVFNEERFRAAGPLGLPSHDRFYPSAIFSSGEPQRYPDSGSPGENSFDLRRPDTRGDARPGPLPPPTPLPNPGN